jgi:hypothetical protein
MKKEEDIDLTELSEEQALQGISDILLSMLASNRCAVVVARDDGALTFLNPMVLKTVPIETMAQLLVESWDEEQIHGFLEFLYG